MAMRTVSFRVKKRFPDLQHLVDAGLMREDELQVGSFIENVSDLGLRAGACFQMDVKLSSNQCYLSEF
jgi:hypothetical protein